MNRYIFKFRSKLRIRRWEYKYFKLEFATEYLFRGRKRIQKKHTIIIRNESITIETIVNKTSWIWFMCEEETVWIEGNSRNWNLDHSRYWRGFFNSIYEAHTDTKIQTTTSSMSLNYPSIERKWLHNYIYHELQLFFPRQERERKRSQTNICSHVIVFLKFESAANQLIAQRSRGWIWYEW